MATLRRAAWRNGASSARSFLKLLVIIFLKDIKERSLEHYYILFRDTIMLLHSEDLTTNVAVKQMVREWWCWAFKNEASLKNIEAKHYSMINKNLGEFF